MNSNTFPTPLISVEWLSANLTNPDLVILDASMGSTDALHIPRARAFDFDKKICDQSSSLPHMMPSPELFEKEVQALGINNSSTIVVYDSKGIYSCARALWMFKAMGHNSVAILEGGLPAWKTADLPTESLKAITNGEGTFKATPRPELFCDASSVGEALDDKNVSVIDARSRGRFQGTDAEPRKGLRTGHMPSALNLPFTELLENEQYLPVEELSKKLAAVADFEQKLIFSCGSGVTACIGAIAAEIAGYKNIAVYDGSWSEWGLPSDRPVVGSPEQ